MVTSEGLYNIAWLQKSEKRCLQKFWFPIRLRFLIYKSNTSLKKCFKQFPQKSNESDNHYDRASKGQLRETCKNWEGTKSFQSCRGFGSIEKNILSAIPNAFWENSSHLKFLLKFIFRWGDVCTKLVVDPRILYFISSVSWWKESFFLRKWAENQQETTNTIFKCKTGRC